MRSFLLVLAIFLVLNPTSEAAPRRKILTASDVEARYGVARVAAMGSKGPLGAYGPLGTLGPIGNGSVSGVMKTMGDWSGYAQLLTRVGGPLSSEGPLGVNGPVGRQMEQFPEVFQEDGDFAVMGNAGVLGALGPLGPLGPMGAHGFAVDADGQYRMKDGRVVSAIRMRYDERCDREYELFEVLSERLATGSVNDTSWMTVSDVRSVGDSQGFRVQSAVKQNVSILVVPEKELDSFAVEIVNRKGQIVARSDSQNLMNWIELPAPRGADFEIRVTLTSTGHFLNHSFRLVVVGSGSAWQCR